MKTFKTGTVARRLGIAPTLLRVWETRYGLIQPERGPGGQRLYSEGDVEVLTQVRELVARGLSIGEISSWSRDELGKAHREHGQRSRPTGHAAEAMPRPQAFLTLDHEGVIVIAAPSVESILGWPHGLLVGQPIWGLLLHVPLAFERLVGGEGSSPAQLTTPVWMRRRDGQVVPMRLACSRRRRVAEGTSTTVAISPLFDAGETGLSPLLESVEFGGLASSRGSLEQMFQHYATTSVEVHDAALARVWTYDERTGALRLVASDGLSQSVGTSTRATIKLASYRYKVGIVARSGIPFIHHGLAGDIDFDRAWVRREQLESAAVLPILVEGRLLGVTAQFFRDRLDAETVGRIQASVALCENWVRRRRRELEDTTRKTRAGWS